MQKTTPLGCCIEEVEQISFFENTSPKAARAKFLGSDGLFCFLSICIFGSFMNPYAMITSPSELFRFRRFILLVLTKKVIFMGVISEFFYGQSMETETTTWFKFPNWEKPIVEQILASEDINQKEQDCESQKDLSKKVNHLSKVIWDRKFITESTTSISFTRIG